MSDVIKVNNSMSSVPRLSFWAVMVLAMGRLPMNSIIDRKTVYHWRKRWLSQIDQLGQIEAEAEAEDALSKAIVSFLSDAPRPGTPVTYSAETVCQIIAVSCEDPSKCGYPLSHWTPQALRLEVIHRQMVSDISVRQIGRFLKGGGSQAASNALLGTAHRRGGG